MYRAGQKEFTILKALAAADPDNKRHCIRMLSNFEYKNHLCLVLEPMHMNLREVIKKYGKEVGITISAVRVYAKQLFIALRHIKTCRIMHADIKPDNIVVNERKTVLKIVDFGSASSIEENEITPYLVSRFYRAPEIILGLPYDYAIDMWAIGCCLWELFTGKILFPGRTNNEMLKLFMELKGGFPKKVLKKSAFASQHFDDNGLFKQAERDKTSGQNYVRIINLSKPSRDLKNELLQAAGPITEDEKKLVLLLKDLLEQCLALNPVQRIKPEDALKHPFLKPQQPPAPTTTATPPVPQPTPAS